MLYHVAVALLLLRLIIDQNHVKKFRVIHSQIHMFWFIKTILATIYYLRISYLNLLYLNEIQPLFSSLLCPCLFLFPLLHLKLLLDSLSSLGRKDSFDLQFLFDHGGKSVRNSRQIRSTKGI